MGARKAMLRFVRVVDTLYLDGTLEPPSAADKSRAFHLARRVEPSSSIHITPFRDNVRQKCGAGLPPPIPAL